MPSHAAPAPTLPQPLRRQRPPLLIALLACALAGPVLAQPAAAAVSAEAAALAQLRATTLGLIDALVAQGLLSRERADALLRQAQTATPVTAAPATTPAAADASTWGSPRTEAGADGKPAATVQRIPYLSETVRAQLREQIKLDVLEQAREERWADSRQIPEWSRRISFSGDLRMRAQSELYDRDNLPADQYRLQTLLAATPAWSPDLSNTTTDRHRLTLRARLGLQAKLSEDSSVALRLSTGSSTGSPSSTSQTLGNQFNKLPITLDRAVLRWEPRFDLRLFAGRMANPFFGTDLIWPDDLSLDGLAGQGELTLASGLYLFAGAGAFALEELNLDKRDKWLLGLQLGADWAIDNHTGLRVALGLYDFRNIEGVRETAPKPSGAADGTVAYLGSAYPASVRSKGNTLINLNDPTSTASPTWGLASKFRPINLSAALTLRQFDPAQLQLSLDWVRNSAFDIEDIARRANDPRVREVLAKTTGLQARALLGHAQLAERGQWQAFVALRKFERDAWVDGFTDTTWHGGGTNYRGFSVGGSQAFDRNTSLSLRWTSTRNLDDKVVTATFAQGTLSGAPLKIDVLQLDLNARF